MVILGHAALVLLAQAAPAATPGPGAGADTGALVDAERRVGAAKVETSEVKAAAEAEKARAAETKAKAEAAKREDAETDAAKLKNGALFVHGLSGGVAAAFLVGTGWTTVELKKPAAAVMPYVMVHPWMLAAPEATREACRASWGGGDDQTASDAARAVARKRAKRVVDAMVNALRARGFASNAVPEATKDQLAAMVKERGFTEAYQDDGNNDVTTEIFASVQRALRSGGDAELAIVIDDAANHEWQAPWNASCFSKKFGVWVGYPFSFDSTTDVPVAPGDTGGRGSRNVKAYGALGLGFAPNTYFSVLLGLTLGYVDRPGAIPATPTTPARDAGGHLWAITIGLGGSIDLVTAGGKK